MNQKRADELEFCRLEVMRLLDSMTAGNLDDRGKATGTGAGAEVIGAVNRILDTVIAPLRLAAGSLEKISRGEIPEFIIEEHKGEFGDIKRSINSFLAVMYGMHYETSNLIASIKQGKLLARGNDWDYTGNWRELIAGVNETLDAMHNPVKEALGVLKNVADHDLCVRMEGRYKGAHAEIKKTLNSTLEILQSSLLSVADSVTRVSASGLQIAEDSQSVADGACAQAASIEEISTELSQIAGSCKQNSANTGQAQVLAESARNSVEDAKRATNEMLSSMSHIRTSAEGTVAVISKINEITQQTDKLAATAAEEATKVGASGRGFAVVAGEVRKLSQRSRQAADKISDLSHQLQAEFARTQTGTNSSSITRIMEVVNEIGKIALQTNLLALNAAVEAAHVGEAARGFEEVTEEVRNLSRRSQEASQNTQLLINRSVELSRTGEALSQEIRDVLVRVFDAFRTVTDVVEQIAGASAEQSQGVEAVHSEVVRMNEVTVENSLSAQRSSGAAEQLARETQALSAMVSKFRLSPESSKSEPVTEAVVA